MAWNARIWSGEASSGNTAVSKASRVAFSSLIISLASASSIAPKKSPIVVQPVKGTNEKNVIEKANRTTFAVYAAREVATDGLNSSVVGV